MVRVHRGDSTPCLSHESTITFRRPGGTPQGPTPPRAQHPGAQDSRARTGSRNTRSSLRSGPDATSLVGRSSTAPLHSGWRPQPASTHGFRVDPGPNRIADSHLRPCAAETVAPIGMGYRSRLIEDWCDVARSSTGGLSCFCQLIHHPSHIHKYGVQHVEFDIQSTN